VAVPFSNRRSAFHGRQVVGRKDDGRPGRWTPGRPLARHARGPEERTQFAILVALSVAHGLNDTVQSLIAASYPILKAAFALDRD